ncbi:MAG TPA: outer membrane lipoprotein carrier protein LolA [Bryobacteraceae bacterium]|nr:outer membrane lipoprotein carrier protein LolA [Bryobacteraceae bacterium]
MHVSAFRRVKIFVKLTPLIGLLVVCTLPADTGLDGILSKVEDHYNRAKTLEVQFTEQYTPPGSIRRMESGKLLLRKPGKMRGEYSQPQGKLFISDGKSLWLYTPDDHRAQKMPLKNTEDLRAPLAFLLGKLHFTKEFRNLAAHPEGSLTRITAEPKTDSLPYSNVEFVVAPDGRIQELKVTGLDRSVLDFTFQQEKDDPRLDARLFEFQLPQGAVLEETAQ